MARKTFGLRNSNGAYAARGRQDNVILTARRMPENGWIRDVHVEAGGLGENIVGRLVVYDGDTNRKLWQSAGQVWGVGREVRLGRVGFTQRASRQREGQRLLVGFYRRPEDNAVWGYRDDPDRVHYATTHLSREPEADAGGFGNYDGNMAAWIEYIPNLRPAKGEWQPFTPDSDDTELNPNFGGTMPQRAGEEGLDEPTNFQIRIFDRTGRQMYRFTYEVTEEDLVRGFFNRARVLTHEAGHDYWADFRHQDSWGVWSAWSDRTFYTARSAPDQPFNVTPASGEKADTRNPAFTGDYRHEDNVAADSIRLRVWNKSRTLRVRDTDQWYSITGSSFNRTLTSLDLAELPWGFEGFWQARFLDANGNGGRWSPLERFRVNSAPRRPANMRPSGGEETKQNVLVCNPSDPDGDGIQTLEFNITDDAGTLTQNTWTIEGPFESGARVELDLSDELVLGTAYTWKSRAHDGILWGEWSEDHSFIYSAVPEAVLVGPPQDLLINKLLNPSAEAELGQIEDWTNSGPDVYSFNRISDGDSFVGEYCFEVRKTDGSVEGPPVESAAYPIDTSKALAVGIAMRDADEENPITSMIWRLSVLDGSGEEIASNLMNGGIYNEAGPDTTWGVFKGYINSDQWPAEAVSAKMQIFPEREPQVATLRFDAGFWVELEEDITDPAALDWINYFDGNTKGSDYYWEGSEHYSRAFGLSRLVDPQTSLVFRYSSEGGTPKEADRIRLQRKVDGTYRDHKLTEWENSDRTSIAIPSNFFRDGERHRIRAEVRDENGLIGFSDWVEFDVKFKGPPVLNVYQVSGDDEGGYIYVRWEPSDVPSVDFVAYEIRVASSTKDRILDSIKDQEVDEFYYHAPVSGETVELMVRQLALVDEEVVGGPWRSASVSTHYEEWYVKSLHDPESVQFGFVPLRGDAPEYNTDRESVSASERNSGKDVFFPKSRNSETSSLTIRIPYLPGALEERNRLKEVLEERDLILQSTYPPKVRYIHIGPYTEKPGGSPDYVAFTFEYTEMFYEEDYYERTGESIG